MVMGAQKLGLSWPRASAGGGWATTLFLPAIDSPSSCRLFSDCAMAFSTWNGFHNLRSTRMVARSEWIVESDRLLKTDYEHHGMGKATLNVVDPAYDLADTILDLGLSLQEEERFIRQYKKHSGDVGLEQRLFMHKLLAGLWAMEQ